MKLNIKNKKTANLVLILLLTIAILIIPYFIRSLNSMPLIPDETSYYNLRVFNDVKNFDFFDVLENRKVPINILYFMPFELSELAAGILSILLGVGSFIFAYLILKKQNLEQKNIYAICLLLVISPIFIYIFSSFNFYSVIIFLNLIGLYFLLDEKPLLSALFLCLIPFIDFYGALVSFVFLAMFLILNHKILKNYKYFFGYLAFALVVSFVLNSISGYFKGSFLNIYGITNLITDVGANIGFSFSMVILFAIGFMLLWEKGPKNLVIYFLMILFFIISFFSELLRIYFNFVLVIYAGVAFVYLTKRKWSINLIKKITLLLIICSMLFSTTSYISRLVVSEPSSEFVTAMAFFKTIQTEEEGVLSSSENGHTIEYFAGKEAFLTSKTKIYNTSKIEVFDVLVASRNLERTEELFSQNNIKYIVIDVNFKKYLENADGLWFLIHNTGVFTKIYFNDYVEIWEYQKEPINIY